MIGEVMVRKGERTSINAVANNEFAYLTDKGARKDIERKIEFAQSLEAPIEEGEIIGKMDLVCDGKVIGSVDIAAGENVNRKGFSEILRDIFSEWIC